MSSIATRLSRDDGKTVVLDVFKGLEPFTSDPPAEPVIVAFVDTETTGVNPDVHEVIEVAVRMVEFDRKTGKMTAVFEGLNELQEPKAMPLPPEIIAITGITDADVRGKRADWQAVADLLESADLVVAFNAGFDRRMLARYVDTSAQRWACLKEHVDWSDIRRTALAQDVLCAWHGFVYDAHRALLDCDAGLRLLNDSGRFAAFYNRGTAPDYIIRANKAPFPMKDILRERGYFWDAENKVWHRALSEKQAADDEMAWLGQHVYRTARHSAECAVVHPQARWLR
uniref:DNA polymerase III subunit epsilon n=1 Tax=uncultured Caudovirales phage TaxID=2100421 RepID=A0A6J5LAN0_9CAUD|nr:DNA polymerase III subunit epsilon [uncultured Caudovirales phage]